MYKVALAISLVLCLLLWVLPVSMGESRKDLKNLLATNPKDIIRNVPVNSGISKVCYDRLQQLLKDNENTSWSKHWFDSWGKVNKDSNLLHPFYLGDFNGCKSIQNVTADEKTTFETRYCLTTFTEKHRPPINAAACIPSPCSSNDLIIIYKKSQVANLHFPRTLKVTSKCRQTQQKMPSANFSLLCIPMLVVVICVIATLYDLSCKWRTTGSTQYPAAKTEGKSKVEQILEAFSLYSNIRDKLQTCQPSGSITCLYGMKVYSFSWVALNHIGTRIQHLAPNTNPGFSQSFDKSLLLSSTMKAHIAVDSFFTISGILAFYTLRKRVKSPNLKGFVKILPSVYLHRYLRLTPSYAFLLIINWKLVCYLYNGPFWHDCTSYQSTCPQTWHLNMLYISNFKSNITECVSWGWYLAIEMQLALVAPFVIYALNRYKATGLIFCAMTICVSVYGSYYLSKHQHFFFVKSSLAQYYFKQNKVAPEWSFYYHPWQRYKSYGIGILTGYIIFMLRQHKKTIPKSVNILLWCAAAGLCLSIVFGPFPVTSGQRKATWFESNMYNTFGGAAWSIGISCVVISCAMGSGGWVNSFLSCKLFVILSNITYCAFLVHQPVSQMIIYGRDYVPTLTVYSYLKEIYTCIAASCLVGFVFSVLFEEPFGKLVRILTKP